jgi:hypothetical protein
MVQTNVEQFLEWGIYILADYQPMYLLYTHLHFNSQKLKEPISVYNHDFKFVLKKLSKQLENLRFFHENPPVL